AVLFPAMLEISLLDLNVQDEGHRGRSVETGVCLRTSGTRLPILTIPGVELMVTKEGSMTSQTSRRGFLGAAAGIAGMSAMGVESASAVIDPAPWGIKL